MSGDAKGKLFNEVLAHLKGRAAYFPTAAIREAVRNADLPITDGSLRVYLSEAVAKGVLHDAGRGWYSRLSERVALDPKLVGRLIRAVEKAFPLLDFCVWSTVQLNPWMHHLLARPIHFLYAPTDTLESIGDRLRGEGWEVAVNPGKTTAMRDVRPSEKMVVLRPAHSKQPPSHGHHSAIEQVLVELLVENEALGLMDDSEALTTLTSCTNIGLVQVAELKRFAEFRQLNWEKIWTVN